MGLSLCGPNSALLLALVQVLCVSRDRSKRFLEDFHRVLLHNATRVGRNPMLRVYMLILMLTMMFTRKDTNFDVLTCLRRGGR